MTRRLVKELHPLMLAWGIGLVAGCTVLATSWDLLTGVSTAVFAGCMAVIAALPFGGEFQQRTLPLLLAQPLHRSRLWGEKVFLVLGLLGIAGVVCLSVHARGANDRLLLCSFLLVTACATPFWTLVARSTIGGAVLNVAGQFLLAGIAAASLAKIRGYELELDRPADLALIAIVILAYSALFLFLGWRKFARLELKDAFLADSPALSATGAERRRWSAWLVCRPRGSLLNLVRKELRLQKPLFLVAGVLALGWLVTLAVYFLEPAWEDYVVGTLNVLTAVQIVLIPVLAGCMSLGEDYNIGVAAWHLTLPVSARRQWFVKLEVSAGVAGLLGIGLPVLLAVIAWLKLKVGLVDFLEDTHSSENVTGLLVWTGVPFVLSFWAATLLRNTVRAALMTVIAIPVLAGCAALAVWISQSHPCLQAPLIAWVMAHLQLPPDAFGKSPTAIVPPALWLLGALGVWIVLAQSLEQFRRAHASGRVTVRYSAILAGFVFLCALWLGDAVSSLEKVRTWPLEYEVWDAIRALPRGAVSVPPGHTRVITLGELEQAGKFSETTKTWLRNASVLVQSVGAPEWNVRRDGATVLPDQPKQSQVVVRFPNGREFVCAFLTERSFTGAGPYPAVPKHVIPSLLPHPATTNR